MCVPCHLSRLYSCVSPMIAGIDSGGSCDPEQGYGVINEWWMNDGWVGWHLAWQHPLCVWKMGQWMQHCKALWVRLKYKKSKLRQFEKETGFFFLTSWILYCSTRRHRHTTTSSHRDSSSTSLNITVWAVKSVSTLNSKIPKSFDRKQIYSLIRLIHTKHTENAVTWWKQQHHVINKAKIMNPPSRLVNANTLSSHSWARIKRIWHTIK